MDSVQRGRAVYVADTIFYVIFNSSLCKH